MVTENNRILSDEHQRGWILTLRITSSTRLGILPVVNSPHSRRRPTSTETKNSLCELSTPKIDNSILGFGLMRYKHCMFNKLFEFRWNLGIVSSTCSLHIGAKPLTAGRVMIQLEGFGGECHLSRHAGYGMDRLMPDFSPIPSHTLPLLYQVNLGSSTSDVTHRAVWVWVLSVSESPSGFPVLSFLSLSPI